MADERKSAAAVRRLSDRSFDVLIDDSISDAVAEDQESRGGGGGLFTVRSIVTVIAACLAAVGCAWGLVASSPAVEGEGNKGKFIKNTLPMTLPLEGSVGVAVEGEIAAAGEFQSVGLQGMKNLTVQGTGVAALATAKSGKISTSTSSNGGVYYVTRAHPDEQDGGGSHHADIANRQIRNYSAGVALIVSVHITHHAGTSFCGIMREWGPTPEFACMGGKNFHDATTEEERKKPWTHERTGAMAAKLRRHFHMVSWEFGHIPSPPLAGVDWEDPRVVSVYITRNPIDRLLSGGGTINQKFGSTNERSEEDWWRYANYTATDNFALNRLTESRCVDGERTTEACLEEGKELLRRFTFVLDQACLGEGFAALGRALGHPPQISESGQRENKKPKSEYATAKDRINNDKIYEYLLRQNRRDIELYNWSKTISLVDCSAIENES